jgi:hypothetical protein
MLNYEVGVPAAIAFGTAVVFAFRLLRHREQMAALRSRDMQVPIAPDPEIMARLAGIEHGMNAIVVEIERLGEGQRFVTKLLADPGLALPSREASRHDRDGSPR